MSICEGNASSARACGAPILRDSHWSFVRKEIYNAGSLLSLNVRVSFPWEGLLGDVMPKPVCLSLVHLDTCRFLVQFVPSEAM